MKKLTLVATAVMGLLSTTATMAQSTVTLYGLLDGGYNHVSGLTQGSVNTIASGIMEGSRWGLRGSEDIGGGYKGIFTLENRLELDTGDVKNRPNSGTQVHGRISTSVAASAAAATGLPAAAFATTIATVNAALATGAFGVNLGGNLFDRQAYVGLVTPFGAVTLGRQYTPGYLVSAAFDASQTQSSLAVGQVAALPAAFEIRRNNSLQYGLKLDGLTAAFMYSAGETGTSSSNERFLGAMAMYKADIFSVGYGHNEKKNELGQNGLKNNIFGATLDVGPGTVYGQYTTIKDNNPSGLSSIAALVVAGGGPAPVATALQNGYNAAFRQDAHLYHIGYKLTHGVHTVVTAFNRLDDRRAINADTDSFGVTYTYALSKRTNLNVVATRFNNKDQGQAAPGGGGFLGGITSAPGVDSNNFALGLRHTF